METCYFVEIILFKFFLLGLVSQMLIKCCKQRFKLGLQSKSISKSIFLVKFNTSRGCYKHWGGVLLTVQIVLWCHFEALFF